MIFLNFDGTPLSIIKAIFLVCGNNNLIFFCKIPRILLPIKTSYLLLELLTLIF